MGYVIILQTDIWPGRDKEFGWSQQYIDALKNKDPEGLKKALYDALGVRIEGISKETDYYTL